MPQTLEEKKKIGITITTRARNSSLSSSDSSTLRPSLKSPRTPRFAEATAVQSPIDGKMANSTPFTPTAHYLPEPQPADVGFGYIDKHNSVEMPKTPLRSPLKSAMRTPGAPPRELNVGMLSPGFKEDILSPEFREEYLEKKEAHTEKRQAQDVKIKTRVRMAKMLMRGVNFSCSLIVLAMLTTTLNIFSATVNLPSRGGFTAWAPQQKIWPQVTLLTIACLSLACSVIVIYAYWRGGHKRAEKAAVYYTAFAVSFFILSIVVWGIGAGVLQGSKQNSDGKDMWSWSCTQNVRRELFQNDVDYPLICRMQNWSLVCAIIEIVVETITIIVYGIIFYRFYSKRALRKSMAGRDTARSGLYLSQLRSQSQPNTPGTAAPYSARDGGWRPPVEYYANATDIEDGTQYATMEKRAPAPFKLQAPPIRVQGATPKIDQEGFSPVQGQTRETTPPAIEEEYAQETQQEHMTAAPGEQVYDFVPPPAAQYTQQEHVGAAPGEQVYESVPLPGEYEYGEGYGAGFHAR